MARKAEAETRIRPLREADIEAIIAIDAAVTGEEKSGFWRGLLMVYEPEAEADADASDADASDAGAEKVARAHPTYLCEVAESGGRVVGFILGDVQSWQFGIPRCGRIIAIGVHPEHRRGGIASKLAREMLETFRKMNLPIVQCLVRAGDPLGEFFGSLGFESSPWITLEKQIR